MMVIVSLDACWAALLVLAVPAALYPLRVLLVDVPDLGCTLLLGGRGGRRARGSVLVDGRTPSVRRAPLVDFRANVLPARNA